MTQTKKVRIIGRCSGCDRQFFEKVVDQYGPAEEIRSAIQREANECKPCNRCKTGRPVVEVLHAIA